VLCGLPFAGKSTLGCALAHLLGIARVELDAINTERGQGLNSAPIAAAEWDTTYDEAYRRLRVRLRSARDVIFDAGGFTRAQRDELRALAAEAGATMRIVCVSTPAQMAVERWQRNRISRDRHDVRDDYFAQGLAAYEPPAHDEPALLYDGTLPPQEWVQAYLRRTDGEQTR
jgi:predicted kinase